MENAIDLALRNINHNIPLEILEVAFENDQRGISIEDCIHEDVIINRILHDANIVAGKIKTIVLDPAWIKKSTLPVGYMIPNTESYSIYNIPPEARENSAKPAEVFGASKNSHEIFVRLRYREVPGCR